MQARQCTVSFLHAKHNPTYTTKSLHELYHKFYMHCTVLVCVHVNDLHLDQSFRDSKHATGFVQNILVAGKPHLGTDRLIKILQAFRKHLIDLGVQIHFGTCVTDLVVEHDRAVGVKLRGEQLDDLVVFSLESMRELHCSQS